MVAATTCMIAVVNIFLGCWFSRWGTCFVVAVGVNPEAVEGRVSAYTALQAWQYHCAELCDSIGL